jgi:alpha-aminoadipic semialdehyde synthase
LLPFEEVKPQNLTEISRQDNFSANRLYKVVFTEADMFRPKNPTDRFDLQDYFSHPEKYESRFEEYIPYLSVLVNAIYWDARCPKLVTRKYLRKATKPGSRDF